LSFAIDITAWIVFVVLSANQRCHEITICCSKVI